MQKVLLQTSLGDIEIELNTDKAPQTCQNFLDYAKEGFYDGTVFHRVIAGFMIQGGGFVEALTQKSTKKAIQNEAGNGLKNDKGTIAMARTMNPHSATSQFFINLIDNDFLNFKSQETGKTWGYAVFGRVSKGMDVVEAIGKVPTGTFMGMKDVPTTAVSISKVSLVEQA